MKWAERILFIQLVFPLLYALIYYFFTAQDTINPLANTVLFAAGLYVGQFLLWADARWFYSYYNPPTETEATTANTEEMPATPDIPQLITRSLLFILSLFPLSIYMITSTGSAMGVGVLLGILVGLAIEMIILRRDLLFFQQHFFYQLRRPATLKETDRFMYGYLAFTLVVSMLVLL